MRKTKIKIKPKRVIMQLDEYIESCRGSGKRQMPNVSGFCRFLGIGRVRFAELLSEDSELSDMIATVFEDEALMCDVPSGVFTQNVRLLDAWRRIMEEKPGVSEMTVVFMHPDGEEDRE